MSHPLTSRDWFGKASAGLILGFVVALGISGLVASAIGTGDTYFSTRGQLTMWLISPVWCGVLSFVFLFRSGARAWGILAIVAAIVWATLWAVGKLA